MWISFSVLVWWECFTTSLGVLSSDLFGLWSLKATVRDWNWTPEAEDSAPGTWTNRELLTPWSIIVKSPAKGLHLNTRNKLPWAASQLISVVWHDLCAGCSPVRFLRTLRGSKDSSPWPGLWYLCVWKLFLLHDSIPGVQVPILNSFVSFLHLSFPPTPFQGDWFAFLEVLCQHAKDVLWEFFHTQMILYIYIYICRGEGGLPTLFLCHYAGPPIISIFEGEVCKFPTLTVDVSVFLSVLSGFAFHIW